MKTLASILFLLFPLMVCSQSISRDVIASGGGFEPSIGGSMSLSYTIGEPMVETFAPSGAEIVLTQGFQQTNLEPVGIEVPEHNLSLSAYPNPTADQVVLELSSAKDREVSLQVFDIQGKALKAPINRQELKGKRTFTVDLSDYASGTYLLGLKGSDGERLHTIKVQKVY